ncbi:MAG: PipA/GogA/GtgA family type III secretion system effector, partial [Rickettsia endosymbiont of Ixodes persulcatus]|nr:PipA/GogA/GtgA family type III secretion system effector [Rickettsia endosymbiont of Ixodes persulcatus]
MLFIVFFNQENTTFNNEYFLENNTNESTQPPFLFTDSFNFTSANSTLDFSLFEDWSDFTLAIKTDVLMATLLMEAFHLSRKQAFIQIESNKWQLVNFLNFSSSKDLEQAYKKLFFSQQCQIHVAFLIKKYFIANPLENTEEIKNQGLNLLLEEQVPNFSIEEACIYQLQEILDRWVDWDQAKQKLMDALQVLKAVMLHYKLSIPNEFLKEVFDRDKLKNIRFFREAALLWNFLEMGNSFQTVTENGISFFFLEEEYFQALAKVLYKEAVIEQLFFPIINNSQAIYFDGLAFKNAKGNYFLDLVNCSEVLAIPAYHKLTFFERQALISEKFYRVGESTTHAIGSLIHSLKSVLIRIFKYQFLAEPPYYSGKEQYLSLFRQVEEQWENKKNFPIHPRLLLALHLAESNDIQFLSDGREKLKQLFEYISNELSKELSEPPQFNRTKSAIRILLRAGMSNEEISKKRYYIIEADAFNLSQTNYGSPLEQFLKLTDWNSIIGKTMYYNKKEINPREALAQEEKNFNDQLYQDTWVQNKAIENLDQQHKEITQQTVEQEAKRIALNYKTETETHRAWIRGLEAWVNIIPVIGPIYSIEEGISHSDPVEVIFGIFFLSLDAADLLLGGDERPNIKNKALSNRLSIHERMTVDTIHSSVKKLDLSIDDLPLDDKLSLHTDIFSIENLNEIPIQHRYAAEQVRRGTQFFTWHNYPVIYLINENRVIPVRAQAGYFREINWRTSEVDSNKHLIFKDEITQDYYTGLGLRGGGSHNPDVARSNLSQKELSERITVVETLASIEHANDFASYDFDVHFQERFTIVQEKNISSFEILKFYRLLYNNSPTFRRIFNCYYKATLLSPEKNWQILVKEGLINYTDFVNKIIYIAPDAEILKLSYMSNANNLESSQLERIYLHEILHALTGASDPKKIISWRNRGPIVYLTDKILSETGKLFSPRVIYRRLSDTEVMNLVDAKIWHQTREEASILAIQENIYLDALIDKKIPISEYKHVFGQNLESRYTVIESAEILRSFSYRNTELYFEYFGQEFTKYFKTKPKSLIKSFFT